MTTITPSDAILLVRKNLDEVEANGSVMYTDEANDNTSMDSIIKKNLPEAINAVHLAAPVVLLEGEDHSFTGSDTVSISTDGILSIALGGDPKYLRLVAFRAADSSIVLTDTIGEASPEGRKQLNTCIRGRADRPRLVILQGKHSAPAFKYYTITKPSDYSTTPSSAVAQFTYIKEQFYNGSAASYNISRRLRQNIIDCLTAMVMETYNDQRAQSFYQKANNFPTL